MVPNPTKHHENACAPVLSRVERLYRARLKPWDLRTANSWIRRLLPNTEHGSLTTRNISATRERSNYSSSFSSKAALNAL